MDWSGKFLLLKKSKKKFYIRWQVDFSKGPDILFKSVWRLPYNEKIKLKIVEVDGIKSNTTKNKKCYRIIGGIKMTYLKFTIQMLQLFYLHLELKVTQTF